MQTSETIRRNADRPIAWLSILLGALVMIGLAPSEWTAGVDHQLRVMRESVITRQASGDIHIAEIDSRSISALSAWPWPREIQGKLVDKLREAGAKTIAFDVDFSAPSNPKSDAAFAAALARAGGGVILPTFRQRSGGTNGDFNENLPIAPLREQAFLASVNVHPDDDGVMRTFTYGTMTQGIARPAMPALLAGAAGRIGETFPVNTSIAPDTLPRHSVSDILSGRVGRETLAGKTVLVGATAIELGDRYAMPRYGIQPGVVIQALAAETLLQGAAFTNFGASGPILLALMLLFGVARAKRHDGILGLLALTGLLALPLIGEMFGLGTVDVAAAAVGLTAGLATIVLGRSAARYDTLRLTDPASGLPNERALRRVLATATPGNLVVMRIRNYDEISELMSEDQRRQLLEQVCARIAMTAGASEIFSLGNGRLAWFVEGEDSLVQLTENLEGLAALFTAKIAAGAQRIIIAPAFGIACGADCADPAHADLAASRAAALGCRWFVYSAELAGSTGRAQQLLADLDEAMDGGDIYMVFQPKLTIANARIEGVEALVRWQHRTIGPVSPDQFIPVFEDSGRMVDLTLYILDRCIEVAERWQAQAIDARIAINVSAPLFAEPSFVAALFARVEASGAQVAMLGFEITESAAVLDDGPMIDTLERLRALGARISIDDYGTGQSTLSYLKKFPADEIKIDQSFVRTLTQENSDQILVRSTIAMAHELGFKVVAEGVEDKATMDLLQSFGCDAVQGWHIGKGVRVEELEPRLLAEVSPERLVA